MQKKRDIEREEKVKDVISDLIRKKRIYRRDSKRRYKT